MTKGEMRKFCRGLYPFLGSLGLNDIIHKGGEAYSSTIFSELPPRRRAEIEVAVEEAKAELARRNAK